MGLLGIEPRSGGPRPPMLPLHHNPLTVLNRPKTIDRPIWKSRIELEFRGPQPHVLPLYYNHKPQEGFAPPIYGLQPHALLLGDWKQTSMDN